MKDSDYILRCLQLAEHGRYYVAPNPMVGAVLVDPVADIIVAEGWHRQYGGPHAEVECFRAADRVMKGLTDAEQVARFGCLTLYVSLEPCSHYGKTPPCADLIIRKGVKRVVVGCLDPNPQVAGRGVQKLRDAGIEVTVGVEQEACRELNKRFLCLHEKHRPYVVLKWAQTADGFMDNRCPHLQGATLNAQPLVISTPVTKLLVHKMRAENMAIMVGTRTALMDNPGLLTIRWPGRNPIRVVTDRHHRIPADAKIFSPDAPTIVYDGQTDWQYVLTDLAGRGIHSVLVEGGPTLLNHILDTKIWDEMHIEVSAQTIGSGVTAPQVNLPDTCDEIQGAKLYTIYNLH
ncbi:MAG: bifunctional diaminohydroxyphosphoribosylaminopyrimidine deaminase/5-amino-6-(5-phosphoribosylamino)uracil reductase RibD [Paludibacteraceae bacterium]|nr:bifunctional diaminohydroxyphosphoribosylaminopyrimidine deaminase/5-amino-6-(5-phosphoribosylamino)uracil reductase RibD [Paludibacteraceae bacterium]